MRPDWGQSAGAEAGGDLGGWVEHAQESSMVAVWSAHVPAVPARCETGDSSKAPRTPERVHVPAGAGDELRPQQRAHARHADDHLRVAMLTESSAIFKRCRRSPRPAPARSWSGCWPRPRPWPPLRQLCAGPAQRQLPRLPEPERRGLRGSSTRSPPVRADPAQGSRRPVTGQQDHGGLGGGVVERPLQGGKYSSSWARNRLMARVRSAART